MLESKLFGCKEFFQSLILVVICPLSSFVTIKVLLISTKIQLPGKVPSMSQIHMHYIRELVHDRTIILQYCPTDEQIADIFTKSFSEKKFTYLHLLLGVSSLG